MHRRALSLMELLLVLALIAGMATLSIPVLSKQLAGADPLSRDAQRIAEQLRRARQTALDSASPVCVQIAAGQNQLVSFVQRDSTQRKLVVLEPGNRFSTSGAAPSSRSQTQLIFREDGSSTGGTFQLTDDHRHVHVRVERSTGQVTIEAAS